MLYNNKYFSFEIDKKKQPNNMLTISIYLLKLILNMEKWWQIL